MSDLQVTIKDKIDIVKACLRQTYGQIYNIEINLQVGKMADDEKMLEQSKTQMAKQLKMKDQQMSYIKI